MTKKVHFLEDALIEHKKNMIFEFEGRLRVFGDTYQKLMKKLSET